MADEPGCYHSGTSSAFREYRNQRCRAPPRLVPCWLCFLGGLVDATQFACGVRRSAWTNACRARPERPTHAYSDDRSCTGGHRNRLETSPILAAAPSRSDRSRPLMSTRTSAAIPSPTSRYYFFNSFPTATTPSMRDPGIQETARQGVKVDVTPPSASISQ
jgi:hypothetical protein